MAKPRKTAAGRWHIQIEVAGVRVSGTFDGKAQAVAWAAQRSTELRVQKTGGAGRGKTLRDALRRFADEVSPTHRGERWEVIRLAAFEGLAHMPVDKPIGHVSAADMALWRDARLKEVSASSVKRELGLLSTVFEAARREWMWIDANPIADVRKPPESPHRERVISPLELRKMLRALGVIRGRNAACRSVSQAVALAMLLALATGMRAGELCAIEWADVSPHAVRLKRSKTGKGRDVPLTAVAKRLIGRLRGWNDAQLLGLAPQTLDALFRRARDRAGLSGFTFHDTRHTAATRLAQKLHVLDLCKVFGWSNTTRALTYYNPSASDLAARMG